MVLYQVKRTGGCHGCIHRLLIWYADSRVKESNRMKRYVWKQQLTSMVYSNKLGRIILTDKVVLEMDCYKAKSKNIQKKLKFK